MTNSAALQPRDNGAKSFAFYVPKITAKNK